MANIPSELKYTKTHEWARREDDGSVTVGITDHAQDLLGDLVYIELPEVGSSFTDAEECAVIESVKAASDIYCPVAGEVVAVNEELADAPETVNNDAYGDGWLFRVQPADDGAVGELMDASEYQEMAEEEEH